MGADICAVCVVIVDTAVYTIVQQVCLLEANLFNFAEEALFTLLNPELLTLIVTDWVTHAWSAFEVKTGVCGLALSEELAYLLKLTFLSLNCRCGFFCGGSAVASQLAVTSSSRDFFTLLPVFSEADLKQPLVFDLDEVF